MHLYIQGKVDDLTLDKDFYKFKASEASRHSPILTGSMEGENQKHYSISHRDCPGCIHK